MSILINKKKKLVQGFSMIELLIVIVIIGLIGSLVAPKMFDRLGTAERGIAEAQMNAFETALDTYRLDMGTYPEALSELRSSDKARWAGPYLPKDIPLDPWGNEYSYKLGGENGAPYKLLSYGADGQPGGEDNNADIIHN